MMRRFNYRFFLCLIAILAVSAAATNFVHAFQVKRTASFLLQQAEHHEKAGSLPNASIYLGRYLALFPKDAEVREDMACSWRTKKWPSPPGRCSRRSQR